jgi:hypothetical protein
VEGMRAVRCGIVVMHFIIVSEGLKWSLLTLG